MRAPNHRAVTSLLTLAALTAALHAQGTPIGFEEIWALAADRAKVVNTLIPGTDDFYYYHCRERLDARDFATVRKVLPTWIERHGENQRVVEVQNRLALLAVELDPKATFDLLRRRLGVTFDHQPVVPGAKSDLPTSLGAAQLSAETRTTQLLAASPDDVDGFTDAALPALAARSLTPGQLHSLLQRLDRPDVDNLPALVVRDLEDPRRGSFGKLRIHHELRLDQLEACARLRPSLLQEPAFVNAWLDRLQPTADRDWRDDPTTREAQLQRLWDFAQRLSPSFNSLKAHVLHHWLRLDLERGAPDKQRFLAYLQLPRRSNHAPREVPRAVRADNYVDPMAMFATGLPQVGDDEAVLRPCLEHFFASEHDHTPYAAWLDAGWLKVVLAETKLLLGQGDQARWYALLDDANAAKQLEQRVEITFARSQRTRFAAGDAVSLLVDVKNVPSLQIKIYEVDSYRYLIERQRPVDASIELDGVVANHEQTRTFTAPPLRRVRTTIDLPELRQPGTYVVELVGNGISSRAVIRKGDLRLGARTTAAGQAISVFDETGAWCRDAKVWFGGREYGADEQGEILLPFSTAPGNHLLVLQQGPRAALARFPHLAESYTLTTRVAVAREALIAGQDATIVLRPQLRLADRELALQLLQDPVLTIVATDLDGRTMPQEVRDPTLRDDGEFVHTLRVPERLQSLTVSLAGRVKTLAGEDQQLTAGTTTMVVNGMDLTAATAGLELVRTRDGYALEVRGKNGEPRGGRSLALTLHHREFRTPFDVVLQTDADGRAKLGNLDGITSISAASVDTTQNFDLNTWRGPLPELLQGLAGETLRLPCPVAAAAPSRRDFALLSVDRDCFEHLAITDGQLELRGLPAGDYELRLHGDGRRIPVRVTAGTRNGGWLIGAGRILQSSPTTPLVLRGIERTDAELVVRLGNADREARVHVLATRFLPQQTLLAQLTPWHQEEPAAFTAATLPSLFHSGRKLGDEYRYVLDRRNETRLPGNMLGRPSLLVNPWQLDQQSFNAAVDRDGKKGTGYDAMPQQPDGQSGPATAGPAGPRPAATPAPAIAPNVPFANLDYLPQGAVVRTNLRPDADGVVRIPLADLGHGQLVQVVAMLGDQMVGDVVVRDELPLLPRPRHLREAIEPTRHVIEQKRMEFVAAGGTTTLDDPRAAQVEVFDSLASVFRVFLATRGSDDLARFAFVCKWPDLDPKQQRELYDQHACHELNFFLYQKDRAFFDAVIRPLLACKLEKTFLDHWLCGDDLTRYTGTWAFGQLNLIERILLAQRLDGPARQAVARSIQEQLELRPIDVTRLGFLLDLSLGSQALDRQDPSATTGGRFGRELYKGPADNAPAPEAKPVEDSRRRKLKDEEADKDAGEVRDEASKESAFDSNQWNSAVGLGGGAGGKEQERLRRGRAKQLYRAVNPTKLHVEQNWWHVRRADSTSDLVWPNRFWADYATAPQGQPFASPAIVEASNSFLEMMMALAVLDLPFVAEQHEVTADGDKRTLRAASPLLLVRKEVTKAEKAADTAPLLLGENFFRLDDRYRLENGQQRDAFVTDEFLVDVAYGCQVVVTNPTSQPRTAELLLQIPAGAVPVQRGFWTKGVTVHLAPYGTQTVEYAFYFPAVGDFVHYPVHAAEKQQLAAFAEPRTLHVVLTPQKLDTSSWEHVSQQGSAADVLTFLDTHNLQRLDLDKIAWRMKDKAFFASALQKLRERRVYHATLWSYALLHQDRMAAREYLQHQDGFLGQCGLAIDSPLLAFEPRERRWFEQLELDPLVHARAHRFGGRRVLGNQDLARQYAALMTMLGYHAQLDADDWLVVTYYLLLQDRVEEALQAFQKVDPAKVATRIQFDYLHAYLCFFTGDVTTARRLAEAHKDEPLPHWQKRFRDVLGQLDEAEGKTSLPGDAGQQDLAATAPSLELAVEGRQVRIDYKNLTQCEVRYYELDVEFAFSAQPFANEGGTSAAFVQPNARELKDLPGDRRQLTFDLPKDLQQKNVLVELRGAGIVRSRQCFANDFELRVLESYGQLAVAEPGSHTPLPRTYVKVFARLPDGTVRFHKDGYTDLRGRFDYASVSDDPDSNATRYAVLVLHDQRGAAIREVDPPTK